MNDLQCWCFVTVMVLPSQGFLFLFLLLLHIFVCLISYFHVILSGSTQYFWYGWWASSWPLLSRHVLSLGQLYCKYTVALQK